MLDVGTCKCGKRLQVNDLNYDHNNFEGDVICHSCQRCYHMEIKKGLVKLGRCRKIFRENLPIPPILYVLGQGVSQNYITAK